MPVLKIFKHHAAGAHKSDHAPSLTVYYGLSYSENFRLYNTHTHTQNEFALKHQGSQFPSFIEGVAAIL